MKRVVLAWEQGSGGGHLEKLVPVAERLQALGCELSFAACDLQAAARRLGDLQLALLPTPAWRGRVNLPPAVSYAEVLLRVGYVSADIVAPLVTGWLNLLRLTRCEVVVCEHSPTAMLAARIAGLPVVALGTGFTLPPTSMPPRPMALDTPPPAARLADAEQHVRAVLNRVIQRHGGAVVDHLGELFQRGTAFLCTCPELDHYGERTDTHYWGALTRVAPCAEPYWPSLAGERVFAYMHPGYRHFRDLLSQLAALRRPTLVVAPGLSGEALAAMQSTTLRVVNEAVDLRSVCSQCRVVVTHGGHGILATLLGFGVPPVLAPAWMEQGVLTARLQANGLAVSAGAGAEGYRYAPAIQRVLTDDALWQRAAGFAARYPHAAAGARHQALLDAVVRAVVNA